MRGVREDIDEKVMGKQVPKRRKGREQALRISWGREFQGEDKASTETQAGACLACLSN